MFQGKFVNLVDLVDRGNTSQSVSQFDTLEELKEYTIATGKYFSKEICVCRRNAQISASRNSQQSCQGKITSEASLGIHSREIDRGLVVFLQYRL